MKGYTDRSRLHLDIIDKLDYRGRLAGQLEASADRICDLQEHLMDGTDKLKSAEYDRLLDEYRAELIRHDRLERENMALEHKRYLDKDLRRLRNQENRERINY